MESESDRLSCAFATENQIQQMERECTVMLENTPASPDNRSFLKLRTNVN